MHRPQGYKLTTQRDASDAWLLPAVMLAADEFLVVYMDGQGIQGGWSIGVVV